MMYRLRFPTILLTIIDPLKVIYCKPFLPNPPLSPVFTQEYRFTFEDDEILARAIFRNMKKPERNRASMVQVYKEAALKVGTDSHSVEKNYNLSTVEWWSTQLGKFQNSS